MLDTDRIKMFLEFRKATKDTVFNLFVLNLFAIAIVFITGCDFYKSFIVLLPFVVIDGAIFAVFKLKKFSDKTVNIFCGIEGILLSMIFQCQIFLLLPITIKNALYWLLISVLINLLVIISVYAFSYFYIRSKKSMANKPVSIAIISMFSGLGIAIARKINSDNLILVCFLLFSAVAAILSVYFLKYKLQKMIEKK